MHLSSGMEVVTQAITPLLQGVIPTYVVTPASLVELFEAVQEAAAQQGLELAMSSPNEILTLKPMTFQRQQAYEMVISLPVVDPKKEFQTFHLVNLPTLRKQVPTIWDLPDMVFGLRPSLYPENAEYVAVEVGDIQGACEEYYKVFLCRVPTLSRPDCIADLFHNQSTHCLTKTPAYVPTLQTATQDILLFFATKTKALLQCNEEFAKVSLEGLVRIEDKADCQIITDEFTYTFVGSNPAMLFEGKAPRIVDEEIMPDPGKIPEEEGLDASLDGIWETIERFNQTRQERPALPERGIVNWVGIGIGLFTLLMLVGAIVIFCAKAHGWTCFGPGLPPPV